MTEELSREEYLYMAKLTEQAEQYGDMVEYMRKVAKMDTDLSVEERNLLSVAYKNHIGAPRASWRVLSSIEQKELHKGNDRNVRLIQNYRQTVEKQLREICQEILSLLDQHLIPHAASGESQVFYYKMAGDYHRYHAEFSSSGAAEREEAAQASLKAYSDASTLAVSQLAPTHPIRLGLALNFSVFYYEVMKEEQKACALAKKAFDDAIQEIDNINEDSVKDATLIMQLLRDNLTLWTSEMHEGDDKGGDGTQVEEVDDN